MAEVYAGLFEGRVSNLAEDFAERFDDLGAALTENR